MILLHSILIGVIQGITEFLPISSSAHLVTVPFLFNWEYQGLAFDTALHFGTFLAIVLFFFSDWMEILSKGLKLKNNYSKLDRYPKNIFLQLIVASIPAALAGFFISDYIEIYFHSPIIIAINLIVFGILLYIIDKKIKSNLKLTNLKYKNSLIIGLAQVLALVPGVSRSGITMTAGRSIGLDREKSARFSFLLGAPVVFGAFVLQMTKITLETIDMPFIVGVLTAALTGFFIIKYLLAYLKKSDFTVFIVYRILLAIIIISILIIRN